MDLKNDITLTHITGESLFTSDLDGFSKCLYAKILFSTVAHGKIKRLDVSKAKALEGVKAIVTAADIPGINDVAAVANDEVCLVDDVVTCIGQGVAVVAAINEDIAAQAVKLIEVEYEILPEIITIEDAINADTYLGEPMIIKRGDPKVTIEKSKNKLEGEFFSGLQEQWYLETQAALSVPEEGGEMTVYSSTQNPTETQDGIARVLGVDKNMITVDVRRLGGGFGGKETQSARFASYAALLSLKTGQPVFLNLKRDEDQMSTGKRHSYLSFYKVAFDDNGVINALDVKTFSNGGNAFDLSAAIMERTLFHIENSYYIHELAFEGRICKTNTPSNTAFRGFGAPQAIAVIELILDKIADELKIDGAEIRKRNFFEKQKRNITYYGQKVEQNSLHEIWEKLMISSDYYSRKAEITRFNEKNKYLKRGIAMTTVKFGISFTTTFLNQGGALVSIYRDGSMQVNHGGIEMGQGLNANIRKIAADIFGLDVEKVRVTPTNTSKVPNTSATAASTGTDINGMAVKDACDKIKKRLSEIAAKILSGLNGVNKNFDAHNIVFERGLVFDMNHPETTLEFETLISKAYLMQVSLSSSGFYKTPDIWFDKSSMRGEPFNYFVFGAAISEVEVNILTGDVKVVRADILHDGGTAIIESINIGQIEGGYIQSIGWLISEDIRFGKGGRMLNISPDTYKIPTICDMPEDFRVEILSEHPNPRAVRQSKAVGEPPFIYGLSAWLAIRNALLSVVGNERNLLLNIPAHNEAIVLACKDYLNI